jgi:hypothetical protein
MKVKGWVTCCCQLPCRSAWWPARCDEKCREKCDAKCDVQHPDVVGQLSCTGKSCHRRGEDVLHSTVSYCNVLACIVMCIVLHCTVFYCTVLYGIVVKCTVLLRTHHNVSTVCV